MQANKLLLMAFMHKPIPLPSQAHLNEVLDYDPQTGILLWKFRGDHTFTATVLRTTEQLARVWNGKNAGKVAFPARKDGYHTGSIDGQHYLAHRVIWKLVNGTEPTVIDHDDRDPDNNRLSNLVDGSQGENMRNRRLSNNNLSGHNGVCFENRRQKWEAFIHTSGTRRFLGYFGNLVDAVAARKSAEIQYAFHPKHGL